MLSIKSLVTPILESSLAILSKTCRLNMTSNIRPHNLLPLILLLQMIFVIFIVFIMIEDAARRMLAAHVRCYRLSGHSK